MTIKDRYSDLSNEVYEGDFNCSYTHITSLKGAPKEVNGDFVCNKNDITSLESGPKEVNGDFMCSNNKYLTSLKGAPKKVNGDFYCNDNKLLTSLDGLLDTNIKGLIYSDDKLTKEYLVNKKLYNKLGKVKYFRYKTLLQEI